MADEMKMARARKVYQDLCTALDHRQWEYTKREDELLVHMLVNGDDLPLQLAIFVEADKQLVTLLSPFTYKMSESKRIEGAVAACVASFGMADGSFDYDINEGGITFRIVASYNGSVLGEGVLQYMISCACAMADKYNDRFLALDKGMLSIEGFIDMENK